MNIQHSSRTDQWFTPPHVISMVRRVLGDIDLDPASCVEANSIVGARRIITKQEDGLTTPWLCANQSIYLNPPGGKLNNKSVVRLFWERLQSHRDSFNHAVFMAFSAEALQTTQGRPFAAMTRFPLCIPAKRIRFVAANGVPGLAPSHSNAIVYVPGRINHTEAFVSTFRSLGDILGPL